MQKPKHEYFLYFSVISVNFLSFSAAGTFSWGSPTLPKLGSSDPEVNPVGAPITVFEESWVIAILQASSIPGSLLSGVLAASLGRKNTLLLLGLPMVIGYTLIAFATKIEYFLIARFLCGITVGSVFSVLPSYVGEISRKENRGILGGVMGICVALSHLFNYIVGPLVSVKVFNLCQLVPLILFYLTFLPFVPESAYYFLAAGQHNSAEKSLKKMRADGCNVEKELLYISERVKESQSKKIEWRDVIRSKPFVKGLLLCCGLMLFQQLSGICAVLAYMQTIFAASGSMIPSHIAPIPVAVVQLTCNIIIIQLVDRLGRRPLLILSASGITIALMSLGTYFTMQNNNYNLDSISWMPVCSLIVFIAFFNFGYASLPWTICAELFSSEVKSLGSSISTCFCLTIGFLITIIFPYLVILLGLNGAFWVFSATCVLGIGFVVLLLPETKGKSSSEIQELLSGQKDENSKLKFRC